MYNVLFLVLVVALSYYVNLLNNFILRLTVSCHVTFFSAAVASDFLAILLLILIKTIAFVNVVKLHSIRVVPISSSGGYYASRCFPEP
jgi:hypothetical protein